MTASALIVLIDLNIERRMPNSPREGAATAPSLCVLLTVFSTSQGDSYLPFKIPLKSLLFYEDFSDFTARTNLSLLWTPVSPVPVIRLALVMLFFSLPDNPEYSLEGRTTYPSSLECLTPTSF